MNTRAGRIALLIVAAFVLVTGLVISRMPRGGGPSPPPPTPPAPIPLDPLAEQLVDDIEAFPLGDHALRDLAMPRDFLRRVADRVIRASYRDRFHTVYRDPAAAPEAPEAPETPEGLIDGDRFTFTFSPLADDRLERWRALEEQRPTNRAYRAAILQEDWMSPALDVESFGRRAQAAADVVATRLAREGLLVTLARAIETLGDELAAPPGTTSQLEALGLPVDLLVHFGGPPEDVIEDVRQRLGTGPLTEALAAELRARPFAFVKSEPTFRCAPESGAGPVTWMRGQLTRGSYWQGVGAGGCLDLVRQVLEQVPQAAVVLSVEEKFLDELRGTLASWPVRPPATVMVVSEPLPVAQWAQDNGKAGAVRDGGTRAPAMLAPRYASRREDGSLFIPGESALAEGVAAYGCRVIHSPLLFQGGNLLCVDDGDRRQLLVGEAEVYRNTALGLTEDQVVEAFRAEFDVERCLVLPSVSFHIDYDLSIRARAGRLIAFVNDTDAAVTLIIDAGLGALRDAGVLDEATGAEARQALAAGDDRGVLDRVAGVVYAQASVQRQYPLSLAEHFAVDDVDSPVGNLQRFLVAMDVLASRVVTDHPDAVTQAYLGAHRRTAADRRRLHEDLRDLGFEVVGVPSLAEADRSLVAINGVHVDDRYLMPAYGGLYAGVDAAAAAALAQGLGDGVRVVPIFSGESQRRSGAVHCSVTLLGDPASWYDAPPAGSSGRGDQGWDDRRHPRGAAGAAPR